MAAATENLEPKIEEAGSDDEKAGLEPATDAADSTAAGGMCIY